MIQMQPSLVAEEIKEIILRNSAVNVAGAARQQYMQTRLPLTTAQEFGTPDKPVNENTPALVDSSFLLKYIKKRSGSKSLACKRVVSRALRVDLLCSAGWKIPFGLRPYITRPAESKIFYAVAGGDLDETLRLFATGEASPYIRDTNGCSLLHVS